MPPKVRKHAIAGRTKKHSNQKRKLQAEAEVTDSSHTNSTTNLNNSESWQCPSSTRRQLIPSTMNIISRRASLRSSKWLLETGITSCSRSSEPHKQREISPATDVTQQLDHMACQVPKGSLVPSSSSSKIKQVVYPSSLKPEMINDKEGEQGGNSLSNHLSQMEGQNTFDEECIPREREEPEPLPLPENIIQASNVFEKRANHSNSISIVGCSSLSPSFSSKLTEIVNIAMLDEDDDEIDSVAKAVGGYPVRPEFEHILTKIQAKHGDIAKNCTSLPMKLRAMLLELVCGMLLEINEQKYFSKIKQDFLCSNIALLDYLKTQKMEVEWLHQGLVEMLDARKFFDQSCMLKARQESSKKAIQVAESKMEEYEKIKQNLSALYKSTMDEETVCKEKLAKEKEEYTTISGIAKHVNSKVRPYIRCSSLMDVLL